MTNTNNNENKIDINGFKINTSLDLTNPENIQELLNQHKQFLENKELKPKINEYENKIN